MKRGAAFVAFVGVFALAQAAPVPETVTIKFKTPGEGTSVLVTQKETETVKIKYVDSDGKMPLVEPMEEETVTDAEYKETILKRDGNKPAAKLEREYTKAHKKKDDKTEDLGLSGKTVVIEKKDDKYTFTFKNGGEVGGTAAEMLTKEFKNPTDRLASLRRLLLPKAAVRPDEQWKLDVSAVLKEGLDKEIPTEWDETKSTGTGKLLKVYTKDGKQFGEMQFKMEFPVKAVGAGAAAIKFAEGAKWVIELTLDVCIDDTADVGTMKTKMSFLGTGSFANMPGSVLTMDVRNEGVVTQKEPAKK